METLDSETVEYAKKLNDGLKFLRQFNQYLETSFENKRITLESYKSCVQAAIKINKVQLQFNTELDRKIEIQILTKRLELIECELNKL